MAQQLSIAAQDGPIPWSPVTRLGFRFAFAYFPLWVLSLFPLPLSHRVVPWIGKHILHLAKDITVFTNGSGDTTYDNVFFLCCVVLAAFAAILWSILDSGRTEYRRLYVWLRYLVRVVLVLALSVYGWDKVFHLQMPSPHLSTLFEPIGQASPFNLLWTFMGASSTYQMFAGFAEVIPGVLLVFPRFTTLGALISMGVMGNVFLLNMSYDVPVKLVSLHLLLFSTFLILPDLSRLANFFLFNRAVEPAASLSLSRRAWLNRAAVVFCGLVFLLGAVPNLYVLKSSAEARSIAERLPLYGVWSVEELVQDGNASLEILSGEKRWQRVFIQSANRLAVQYPDGSLNGMNLELDSKKNEMKLSDDEAPGWKGQFALEQPDGETLNLKGTVNGKGVRIRLHKMEAPKFVLMTRGFHWINENVFWH
jgi:uncharacterized membrane protein YphA (DoxX/SURF4 family)